MRGIKTHSHTRQPATQSTELRFTLNPLFPLSSNIDVRQYPKRVIAWGLEVGERVSVQMARVQSVGNSHWAMTEDCCPCVIEPDQVANVQHLPYKRCGNVVELTAENPAIHIDDAGTYYFEYHGNNEVILDHYDDPVIRKTCDCA